MRAPPFKQKGTTLSAPVCRHRMVRTQADVSTASAEVSVTGLTRGCAGFRLQAPPLLLRRRLLFQLFQLHFQHPLLLLLGELGKQELNLQPHAPRRSTRRMHCVAIELTCDIDGLESDLHDSSHATTEGNYRLVTARGTPIGGDDRRGSEVPPLLHVVVDEPLQQHLVHHCPLVWPSHRPDVVDQCAKYPMT